MIATKEQTIFDIALMQYGDVAGVAKLLAQNPSLLQPNGLIAMFGANYKADSEVINEVIANTMLILKPTTE